MYAFHESTTKRFYFDWAFKKGNLEPTYLSGLISYRAPIPPSDHSQTGLRDSPGTPEFSLLPACAQPFLLGASPQPATASPGRSGSEALRKSTCFLTGKYLPSPGTPQQTQAATGDAQSCVLTGCITFSKSLHLWAWASHL